MRAVFISAALLGTAATFFGTAKITSTTVQATETAVTTERAKFAELEAGVAKQIADLQQESGRQKDALKASFETQIKEHMARLAEQDTRLSERETQLNEAKSTVKTLEDALDVKKGELATAIAQVSDLTQEIAKAETPATDSDVVLAETDPDGNSAALESMTKQVSDLNAEIASLTSDVALLETDLKSANLKADASEAKLAELTATLAERDTTIAGLNAAQQEELETATENGNAVAALQKERDDAIAALKEQEAKTAQTLAEQAETTAEIAQLKALITERDATIAALETPEAPVETADAPVETVETSVEAVEAPVVTAEAPTETPDASVEAAEVPVEAPAEVAEVPGETVEATNAVESPETLETAAVVSEEAPEPELSPQEIADLCFARARDILTDSQINFRISTASINAESRETLERLRGVAADCQNPGLYLEIGGHTDSQGSEVTNQALSDARAQAVVEFLTDLGVPADSMRAVGFGESIPIATNETREGRTANRRITFVWNVLETETETETPNG